MNDRGRALMNNQGNSQQGLVLFMSLVILLLLTVLGVSSFQTAALQSRMARSVDDIDLAFQSAEAALLDGEEKVERNGYVGGNGYYRKVDSGQLPNWAAIDWAGKSNSMAGTTGIEGVTEPARYIIEYVRLVKAEEDSLNLSNIGEEVGTGGISIYRVTARGLGFGKGQAAVMVQSHYGRRE